MSKKEKETAKVQRMRKSYYEIRSLADKGMPIYKACLKIGVSERQYYRWRDRFDVVDDEYLATQDEINRKRISDIEDAKSKILDKLLDMVNDENLSVNDLAKLSKQLDEEQEKLEKKLKSKDIVSTTATASFGTPILKRKTKTVTETLTFDNADDVIDGEVTTIS